MDIAILELELLQTTIMDFYMDEYDIPFMDAKDEVKHIHKKNIVPIAYTTLGDNGELEIQVNFNVAECRLESHVSGIYVDEVEYLQYDDLKHASYDIKHADFTDIIRLSELDADELADKENKLSERN